MSLRLAVICASCKSATAQTNLMRSCEVVTNVARVEAGDSQNPQVIGNSRSGDPGPGNWISPRLPRATEFK